MRATVIFQIVIAIYCCTICLSLIFSLKNYSQLALSAQYPRNILKITQKDTNSQGNLQLILVLFCN